MTLHLVVLVVAVVEHNIVADAGDVVDDHGDIGDDVHDDNDAFDDNVMIGDDGVFHDPQHTDCKGYVCVFHVFCFDLVLSVVS
mgnify:CR=1 FL=1